MSKFAKEHGMRAGNDLPVGIAPTGSRDLKIAVFHYGFFYSGGGEKLVLEEIRGLRALGHRVDCYAPFVDREGCYPDVPEMEEIRTLLPAPPPWLPMKDPLWVTLCCLLIPFMAPRFAQYDILVGANQPGPWLVFALSRVLRKPYIIYLAQPLRLLHPREVDLQNGIRIREGDHLFLMALKRLAGWFINWADRISVTNASITLTNGDHVARWIKQVYGTESRICPAGCHPAPECDLDYDSRWKGSISAGGHVMRKPYILLTNRHSPMKRFEYALWAIKAIAKRAPRIRLVITGQETEYTEQLRYLARGLRIEDRVDFVGLVPEDDLRRVYLNAALYVYPSPEEDFGMGIVEAMAAGTPVVAWANGGPTVTVKDHETGYLVTPYDTDEFAERMLQLVSSHALEERMGRAAHRRAAEFFSYDLHNDSLAQALLDAVANRGGAQAARHVSIPAAQWVPEEVEVAGRER